jgi:Na+-transporting methylmalonyl-CoA/oxaloacetate decarboxylase gamma subunit
LTFVYLVFLSILNFMKKIVSFAEREEWSAPKKRKSEKKKRR